MQRTKGIVIVGALAALAWSGALMGGPINPPAGPVSPTGRTLQEIFDKPSGDGRISIAASATTVTINQPGSYVLTGNITVGAGSNGVFITASNVTLDLNGYTISGATGNTSAGILLSSVGNVRVRNGNVERFGGGVNMVGVLNAVTVEDLLIRNTRSTGINTGTQSSRNMVLRRCRVVDVGGGTSATDALSAVVGIQVNTSCVTIEECTVERMLYNGTGSPLFRGIEISGGTGMLVKGCVVKHDGPLTGAGIFFGGTTTGIYRDNTVQNFSAPYNGGTNGGGNL